MSNINNTKRIYSAALSLGILTLLVMVFALPSLASAETAGFVNKYNSEPMEPMIIYEQQIVRVPAAVATQTYSNNPKYSNTASTTNTENATSNTTTTTENTTDRYSNLAASAVYGDSTFAPSGFVQWIMIAILILVIIILSRKIFGATDRYHQKPMKHA